MQKWVALLLAALLLGGCVEQTAVEATRESQPESRELPQWDDDGQEVPSGARKNTAPAVEIYFPPDEQTPEEVVEAYFSELYFSYCALVDVDLSAILDTEQSLVASSVIWSQKLTQRRRLLAEHELCYVETEPFPYEIRYLPEEALEDPRMEFWSTRRPEREGDVTLHFVITGETGRAYPPQMALNTQHTVRLRRKNGRWMINFLYYPGSYRKYLRLDPEIPTDEQALAALREEFRETGYDGVRGEYDGMAAAEYARRYTERRNPAFYDIGDWMGNCANFTSQCVWAGFVGDGDPAGLAGRLGMTGEWYAGEGGGSPAWENVERFWQYISAETEMRGQELDGIAAARPGDMIQTSSLLWEPDEDAMAQGALPEDRYNHSLIVVDADTLLLAQNSPGCFVYYADLPDVTTRIVRPLALL